MSDPLTIVMLLEKFCAVLVFAKFSEVTMFASDSLLSDVPMEFAVSKRLVSATVVTGACAVTAEGCNVALSTRLLRFCAVTCCPMTKVVPLVICPICLCL